MLWKILNISPLLLTLKTLKIKKSSSNVNSVKITDFQMER